MSPQAFRAVIALMLERFGHTVTSNPDAAELVTAKAGMKYLAACAHPTELEPTSMPAVRRLHDAVVRANAQRGFYFTARSFTPEAARYADCAPIDLIDGDRLVKALNQSRKHVLLPQTYKAMCRQCGEIVMHRIDEGEALPCVNGHLVVPTIARAMIVPSKVASSDHVTNKPTQQPMSRRRIRAHNHRVRARAKKRCQADQ